MGEGTIGTGEFIVKLIEGEMSRNNRDLIGPFHTQFIPNSNPNPVGRRWRRYRPELVESVMSDDMR